MKLWKKVEVMWESWSLEKKLKSQKKNEVMKKSWSSEKKGWSHEKSGSHGKKIDAKYEVALTGLHSLGLK